MIADARYVVAQIAKNAAAAVFSSLKKEGCGINGDPLRAVHVLEQLAKPMEKLGVGLRGSRVLELGPGRSPELSAACVLAGAKEALLVDVEMRIPPDARETARFAPLVAALGESAPCFLRATGSSQSSLEKALVARPELPLITRQYDGRSLPAENGSVDVIFSNNVLQHVAPPYVDPLLAEHYRVLRPGGIAVHLIDLRDHMHVVGDDDVDGDWLEALQWSEPLFRAMFSKRSTAINRLRACEWRQRFELAGFRIAFWDTRTFPLPHNFDRRQLHTPWRNLDEAELSIAWVSVGVVRD